MKTSDFIKESIGEDADEMHRDHEVQMARSDCYNAAKYAIELHKMLHKVAESQGLDGWVSEKITLANDYLRTVWEYMSHEFQAQQQDAVLIPEFNFESADQQFNKLLNEGAEFGAYYYEQLAQKVFDKYPDLNNEDNILNFGYAMAKEELGKRANGIFRDEDFPSDFVSAYFWLKKQGVAEADISRRGFLRGLGAAALGATALGAAGKAQARVTPEWLELYSKAKAKFEAGYDIGQVAKALGVTGPNNNLAGSMGGEWGAINKAARDAGVQSSSTAASAQPARQPSAPAQQTNTKIDQNAKIHTRAVIFAGSNPEFKKEYDRLSQFHEKATDSLRDGLLHRKMSANPDIAQRQRNELLKQLKYLDQEFEEKTVELLKFYKAPMNEGEPGDLEHELERQEYERDRKRDAEAEQHLNEIDPGNYDSDWDYYAALKGKRPPEDDDIDPPEDDYDYNDDEESHYEKSLRARGLDERKLKESATGGASSAGGFATGPTAGTGKPGTGKPKKVGNMIKRANPKFGKGIY